MASVVDNPDFDPEYSAEKLRHAMKGLGTDEQDIIEVLATHTYAQRAEIAYLYKSAYGRDLMEDLRSELGGNFEQVVMALMTNPAKYDAKELRSAMKGAGTDEATIIEIMCGRDPEQIAEASRAYDLEFNGRNLEEDLASDTSGHFRSLLVSLSTAGRDRTGDVDAELAVMDAQEIYDAGEARFGTDEAAFNKVLSLRNYNQLLATFHAYEDVAGSSIEEVIESETSGCLQDGYLAIVKYTRDPQLFFAERLYKSMKGLGTDDDTLIRVMVSCSEIDLGEIAEVFRDTYGKTLAGFIKGDCSGDYKRMLLALLG